MFAGSSVPEAAQWHRLHSSLLARLAVRCCCQLIPCLIVSSDASSIWEFGLIQFELLHLLGLLLLSLIQVSCTSRL